MLKRLLPVLLLGGCQDQAPGGMTASPMGGSASPADVPTSPYGGPGSPGGPEQAPPGFGGGGGGGGGEMAPTRPAATGFNIAPGQGVKLSGVVSYPGTKTGVFRIDFLQPVPDGFPDLVATFSMPSPGPWELEAPKNSGDYRIVAFLDANDNGPDPSEPRARIKDLVAVAEAPITGLDLVLSDTPDFGGPGDGAPGGQGNPPGGGQGGYPGGGQGGYPGGGQGGPPGGGQGGPPGGGQGGPPGGGQGGPPGGGQGGPPGGPPSSGG